MDEQLEHLSEDEKLKIYNCIREQLDRRGLDIDKIRKVTDYDLNKHYEGRFLNLIIKSAQ